MRAELCGKDGLDGGALRLGQARGPKLLFNRPKNIA